MKIKWTKADERAAKKEGWELWFRQGPSSCQIIRTFKDSPFATDQGAAAHVIWCVYARYVFHATSKSHYHKALLLCATNGVVK